MIMPLEETKEAITEGYKDLESILEDFLERLRNNELILQIYPAYAAPNRRWKRWRRRGRETEKGNGIVDGATEDEEGQRRKNERVSNEENSYREIRETHETEFVLEGSLVIDFNIE